MRSMPASAANECARIGAEKEAHAWINDHALTRNARALQHSEPILEEADDRIKRTSGTGNVGTRNVIGSRARSAWRWSRHEDAASAGYMVAWGKARGISFRNATPAEQSVGSALRVGNVSTENESAARPGDAL